VQAIGRQPHRAPDGVPVHYERHRPEQTTLYRLVQQNAATFFAETEAAAGADLPQFVKDEFDALLECGWPTASCGCAAVTAATTSWSPFSSKRRGFCPSCGARRMAQTAAYLVDCVIPVCRCASGCCRCRSRCACCWPLSPRLLTPVLQVVHRELTRFLLEQAGMKADEADSGAVLTGLAAPRSRRKGL
jgi:hypothetical protein